MTALATTFTFIYVYIRYLCVLIFGGSLYLSSFSGEAYSIAKGIFDTFGYAECIVSPGIPILALFIGIIVVGAIIGLAHRLIRG